jgi:hypothetical protein
VHRASTQGAGEALSQESFLRKSLGRFRPRHPVTRWRDGAGIHTFKLVEAGD